MSDIFDSPEHIYNPGHFILSHRCDPTKHEMRNQAIASFFSF